MKTQKFSKLIYFAVLFLATSFVINSCKPKPKIQPMTITLKMPTHTTTPTTSFPFPSDIMGTIKIDVYGAGENTGNYDHTSHSGSFLYDCIGSGAYCPKNSEFQISVPRSGDFTIYVKAITRTCSSLYTPSCKSETGLDVGALLIYNWGFTVYNGELSPGGTLQLQGEVFGRSGNPWVTTKCCCANRIAGLKCGQQSNGTAFVSCVPIAFETAYNYTGVCGANDENNFGCPGVEDIIDYNTNCGKECSTGKPCTESGYQCSSSNSTGICQLPCKFDAQCPAGLGCNTGWCR